MSAFQVVLLIFSLLILSSSRAQNLSRVKRIVGGGAAAIPPEDDPVVFVARGKKYAEIYGERDPNGGFYAFKGIRYGMPPFGQNRFQRPKEMPLEGEHRALKYGPPCPQMNEENELIGHEDCLFLNVFVPTLPDLENKQYPVLIWIHGGGFRRGSANQYGMTHLMKKNVIVVSIQYRLGTLGFISSGTPDLPGNNGIFDMMLAVRWVKKYIEFFGGDTAKITVFGHEVGASSALILGLSKLTNHNLNGIIAMSGSSLSNFAIDKKPAETAKLIAAANNCTTENIVSMVKCLKEVPVDRLVNVDSDIDNKARIEGLISSLTTIVGARPVVEGSDDKRALPHFTPDSPEHSLSLGDVPNIPLLTGIANNEAQGAVLGDHKKEISNRLADDPEYVNNYLVPKLQKNIPHFNITKYFTPNAFNKYFQLYDKSKHSLQSIKDAVEDALFNVPAYLTVKYWSQKAKTIFYSFDHTGKKRAGSKFLAGSPFVSKNPPADSFNFGDDLGYIFDQHTMLGNKIKIEEMDQEDEQVTETFTDMVAQFARSGNYHLNDKTGKSAENTFFSESENNYISIGKAPQIMKDFRFCEIGLWMGIAQRLQSTSCNFLRSSLETVNTVVETPKKVIEKVDIGLGKSVLNQATPNIPIGKTQSVETLRNSTMIPKDMSKPLPNFGNFGKLLNPIG